ncbi:hypothetical protein V6N12_020651 [Hibiscus sabdariffa]|uniref:Uncharacterized protein n=1 Tax=Hibiscus sabdariffa TaxID=183260 RepID=A0ABR2CZJ8_9ROSI
MIDDFGRHRIAKGWRSRTFVLSYVMRLSDSVGSYHRDAWIIYGKFPPWQDVKLGDCYRSELYFDEFYCPCESNCNGLDGCLSSHLGKSNGLHQYDKPKWFKFFRCYPLIFKSFMKCLYYHLLLRLDIDSYHCFSHVSSLYDWIFKIILEFFCFFALDVEEEGAGIKQYILIEYVFPIVVLSDDPIDFWMSIKQVCKAKDLYYYVFFFVLLGFAGFTISDMLNPSFPLLALKGRILADYFKIWYQLVFKRWISWYLLQLVNVVAIIIDIFPFPKLDVLDENFAHDFVCCHSFNFHFLEDLGFVCFRPFKTTGLEERCCSTLDHAREWLKNVVTATSMDNLVMRMILGPRHPSNEVWLPPSLGWVKVDVDELYFDSDQLV